MLVVAAVLGERAGDAQERGERVVDTADLVEVVGHSVAGGGLDDHPGAVRREHLPDVTCRADRVAHVVQAVEAGHQVVWAAAESLRRRDVEPDLAAYIDATVAPPAL